MLKRTPFKRKPPERYVKPERVPKPNGVLTRPFNGVRFTEIVSQPKREYVRSRPLLDSCRCIPCQHCGMMHFTGRVVAAHSNWSVHGKGGHIKADDNRVASLCDECHIYLLDQGSKLSQEQRQEMWWRAHVRTVRQLTHLQLWPSDVPVPDITRFPFPTKEPA